MILHQQYQVVTVTIVDLMKVESGAVMHHKGFINADHH